MLRIRANNKKKTRAHIEFYCTQKLIDVDNRDSYRHLWNKPHIWNTQLFQSIIFLYHHLMYHPYMFVVKIKFHNKCVCGCVHAWFAFFFNIPAQFNAEIPIYVYSFSWICITISIFDFTIYLSISDEYFVKERIIKHFWRKKIRMYMFIV